MRASLSGAVTNSIWTGMRTVVAKTSRSEREDLARFLPLELGHRRCVPQSVESGTIQARTAVAPVEVDVLFFEAEYFLLDIRLEPPYLFIDLLISRLGRGRNSSVDRSTNHSPPSTAREKLDAPVRLGQVLAKPSPGAK